MTTKLKVLVIKDSMNFADYGKLEQGVHSTIIPKLFKESYIMEDVIEDAKQSLSILAKTFTVHETTFLENLKKCELKLVTLIMCS